MAWCYAFGVGIDKSSGCTAAMRVVRGEARCACPECGVVCPGRFAACTTLIFAPGGEALQDRCQPPSPLRASALSMLDEPAAVDGESAPVVESGVARPKRKLRFLVVQKGR